MKYALTVNNENQTKYIFDGVGKYDIPEADLFDSDVSDCEWISFNYLLTEKQPENKVCHFYLDDYQFNRVWNSPDKYIDKLRKFRAVTSPDFSLWTDYPKALQIYSHFKKQWCNAYWNLNGIQVIPTVCWSDENSYDFCFDGIPQRSAVTISDIGCNGKEAQKLFYKGFNKMLETLDPKEIYLYTMNEDTKRFYENSNTVMSGFKIKVIKNKTIQRLRRL